MTLRSLRHSLGRCALLPALLALSSTLAQSEAPKHDPETIDGTVWQCEYRFGTMIYCQIAVAPTLSETHMREIQAENHDSAGDESPNALPYLATLIHEAPSQLVNRRIAIPIFSRTRDVALAHELADAVMCNAQPACRVEFVSRAKPVRDALASR